MRFKTSFFEEDEEINMAPMIDMVFAFNLFHGRFAYGKNGSYAG